MVQESWPLFGATSAPRVSMKSCVYLGAPAPNKTRFEFLETKPKERACTELGGKSWETSARSAAEFRQRLLVLEGGPYAKTVLKAIQIIGNGVRR